MGEPSARAGLPEPGIQLTRLALLIGLGYLLLATFQPFFSALIWSAVLSYGLYPLFRRLVHATGGRRTLSATVMSIGVTVGLILPLAYVFFLIGKELAATYLSVTTALQDGPGLLEQWRGHPWVSGLVTQLQEFLRLIGTDIRSEIVDNLADLGGTLVEKMTLVAGNVLAGLVEVSVILLSTFYFFRDGGQVIDWMKGLLPLREEQQRLVVQRFHEVVKGAVIGNTLIAILEGVVGALAFWLVACRLSRCGARQ